MISVLVLLGLGLETATVLAVASRVFHVCEDPRVQAVLEALPGGELRRLRLCGLRRLRNRRSDGTPPCPRNRCCAEVRKQALRWAN